MSQLISNVEVTQFDRLPPHSLEAEMCLIGSMMLVGDDKAAFAEMCSGVTGDSFYSPDHQIMFDAIVTLRGKNCRIDSVILREELARRHLLNEVGGSAYIAQILNMVPSYAHGPHYAGIVKEKHGLRQLITAANAIIRGAYAPTTGEAVAQVAMKYAAELARIGAEGHGHPIHSMDALMDQFEAERRDPEALAKLLIKTGIDSLDDAIGGLRKGTFTLVGARPGMGKSMLNKQVLRNIASRGTRCGLISVEEGRQKISENNVSSYSGVDNWKIAQGKLSDDERAAVNAAVDDLRGLPIWTIDTASALNDIVAAVHQLALRYGCEIIAIDHLHLIDGGGKEANRTQEVSAVSRALKMVSRELGVASFVTAQLNRGGDGGPGGSREPTMRDLRDSGSLEQDGDVILLLHREDYYRQNEVGYAPTEQLKVIIAKHKSSGTGVVPLYFDERHQTVTDWNERPGADPF